MYITCKNENEQKESEKGAEKERKSKSLFFCSWPRARRANCSFFALGQEREERIAPNGSFSRNDQEQIAPDRSLPIAKEQKSERPTLIFFTPVSTTRFNLSATVQ